MGEIKGVDESLDGGMNGWMDEGKSGRLNEKVVVEMGGGVLSTVTTG